MVFNVASTLLPGFVKVFIYETLPAFGITPDSERGGSWYEPQNYFFELVFENLRIAQDYNSMNCLDRADSDTPAQ